MISVAARRRQGSETTAPVAGSRNKSRALSFSRLSKSNILLSEPAIVSNEPPGWMRWPAEPIVLDEPQHRSLIG